MDLKDSKTQKIALGLLFFAFIIWFWYTRVYSQKAHQLDLKTQEFETIATNLRNVEMKAKSLEALKLEYEQLVQRYHEIEELLPEVKQIPSFLVQLHTASSITGTKITRIQPLPIGPEAFYNVAAFQIEMTGTYHDFGSFLSYVANFPFIANVSDVQLRALDVAKTSKQGKDGSNLEELKKKETLTATFTISTYFVKEEERLKELVL